MRAAPRATYRVQLRRDFDFAAACGIVPYLADLGFSHLYCSPYMQAAPGSAHGYDVVDPTRINTELGGDAGLERLDAALAAHGMGQLLDIVPNHMCVGDPGDEWWWDVLRRGRDSAYARFFDIDWNAPGADRRIILPVLGDELDDVLARGELRLESSSGSAELVYFDHRFPLRDGDAGDGDLHDVVARQHYRLEYWRSGLRRISYRRFFDVSTLAGVRVEDPIVCAATHERTLRLVHEGTVDGLRVDHIDGLREPSRYAAKLRDAASDAWLIVEKILAPEESLPSEWPVDGTTGYDFTALVIGLMVDPQGMERMLHIYRGFTGDEQNFATHSHDARVIVLDELLSSEVDRLDRCAERAGIEGARTVLTEFMAAMPVYRVYPDAAQGLSGEDESVLRRAAAAARPRLHGSEHVLDSIVALLSDGSADGAGAELRLRFQQVSSAAMAKGVEDTAFYRFVPLVALNEVGCDPTLTTSLDAYHAACEARAERSPRSLLATATHDTKRGEDARIRVAMLSEMPDVWEQMVERLHTLAARHRRGAAPSPTAEYLLYQTLVAAHPIDSDRLCAYMLKAVREAKQETSWLEPDIAYEKQLESFVRAVLADADMANTVAELVDSMTPAWQHASLSQTLLKLTSPGVADVYQGCELWDLRLVDPDNRTPVDYGLRSKLLRELDALDVEGILGRMDEGLPKLHLIREALRLRTRRHGSFAPGAQYVPLQTRGAESAHVVAYARAAEDAEPDIVVVAVRLARSLGHWTDTSLELPAGSWRDVLTGGELPSGEQRLASLLRGFPVALLERVA